MLTIQPFAGFRPPVELAKKVAALPYDVMNSAEAREMALGNPYSFLHVTKPEIDLDPGVNLYDDQVYAKAASNLDRWISEGYLVQDDTPCLYVYRQKMGDHVQTGLVAACAVDDYDENRIKKHEKTRQDKEDDRARHVDETGCNAGPVFLTYRAVDILDRLMASVTEKTPDVDFVSNDGIGHTLWKVSDGAWIEEVRDAMKQVPCSYVADGHHRAKSGSRVREARRNANPNHDGTEAYNFFMAVLFPHDQLQILPYNRALKTLNGLTYAQVLEKLAQHFDVEDIDGPATLSMHQFNMFLDDRWYLLKAKEEILHENDPIACLDVSILQDNVLHPLFGIDDPRTSDRIDFVGGIRGNGELERICRDGSHEVAFGLYPTTVEQLMDIADADAVMPPKSTWFEPKLRSGLVVHVFGR